jgi:transcriptional regulator with XRE-family HTH domain
MSKLGDWIKSKYKSQAAFAEELGVQQSRVSKWLSGAEAIPEDFRDRIERLKYKGPWPREEAQAAPTASGASEEVVKLKGRVEALENQILAALVAAKSLDERVQALERRGKPPG